MEIDSVIQDIIEKTLDVLDVTTTHIYMVAYPIPHTSPLEPGLEFAIVQFMQLNQDLEKCREVLDSVAQASDLITSFPSPMIEEFCTKFLENT